MGILPNKNGLSMWFWGRFHRKEWVDQFLSGLGMKIYVGPIKQEAWEVFFGLRKTKSYTTNTFLIFCLIQFFSGFFNSFVYSKMSWCCFDKHPTWEARWHVFSYINHRSNPWDRWEFWWFFAWHVLGVHQVENPRIFGSPFSVKLTTFFFMSNSCFCEASNPGNFLHRKMQQKSLDKMIG